MAYYRIYSIGSNGHFADVEAASFAADDEAMRHAVARLDTFKEAEVWSGNRLIGRAPSPPVAGVDAIQSRSTPPSTWPLR